MDADTSRRIYEITITLRSGKEIIFDALTYNLKTDPDTGRLTSLNWTCPADTADLRYRALWYIDLHEIIAIVVL